MQLINHSIARFEELGKLSRLRGHAHEIPLIVHLDVAQLRIENFMNRSVVTCKVNDECPPNARRNTLMLEKLHDVEEIARVLPIQSSHELSSVDVFGCENWNLNVSEQGIAGQGR